MAEGSSEDMRRIADALERLSAPHAAPADWTNAPAYLWDGNTPQPIDALEAPQLELLVGLDDQKAKVCRNIDRLASGHAAHDMLLWGARGMGKSALLRAAITNAQSDHEGAIALVQISSDALDSLPGLFAQLAKIDRNFLLFIDDIGFAPGDSAGPRALRSWLEGGVAARPANVRLAVTSNRRAIVAREAAEQDGALNPRDAIDDALALSDRFGLSLGFHNCDQDTYLAIVRGYAEHYALDWNEHDALQWAKRRGARSGRIAWHYITEIAGQAGKRL